MAFEVENFELEVLQESKDIPVVVDFWAAWCGPCQVLGPVIEKLASEAEGKWKLVKVDVEAHQDLSSKYKIRGIPAVKLFVNGEVIAEFSGALPAPQISQWLAQNIPSEYDQKVQEAVSFIQKGEVNRGKEILELVLKEEQHHANGAFHLGKLLIFNETERAQNLLKIAQKVPQLLIEAQELTKLAQIISLKDNLDKLEELPIKSTFSEGLKRLSVQDFEMALEHFIQVITLHKAYHNESARIACIAIFNYLGSNHEVSKKYRRRFDMALY